MNFNAEYPLINDIFHVYKEVNYKKMMSLIYNFKTGVIVLGGPWCKNCQAVMHLINETAKKNKIRSIYHFDPKFTNVFKEEVDFRDCLDLETKLDYYQLIEKIGYKSKTLVKDTLIPRLPIPAVIGIKNGACVGIITDEYILDEKGLHTEQSDVDMTEDYCNKLTELFIKVKEKDKIKRIKDL